MKFFRLPLLAKFTALAGAIVWGAGITLTVISFNRHNPNGYSPRDHFISELGLAGTSALNGLFNLTEAVGSLLAVPIAWAMADRVRTKSGRRAVALAITAFLAASALGWMGLAVDLLRPEYVSTVFLLAHFSAAIACFGCWFAAAMLFAVDFARQPEEAGVRFLTVVGIVSGAAGVLLFGATLVAALRLPAPAVDPVFRAILQSRATPQMFNGWIEGRRAGFTSVSTMEWTVWATMVLWLGSAVALLGNATLSREAEAGSGVAREAAIARWISILGHPFAFVVLLLLVPFLRRGQLGALRVAGVVAVAGLVPLGFFMRQRFRSGRWLTVDASAPRDRPVAYLAAFAVLVPVTLYFSFIEHSRILVDGSLVIGAMMAIALALNRWIKGSGHMAFAAFSAVVFTRVAPLFAVGVMVFIPLLAWSRIRMRRHSLVEVIGGCALGACAGCVMLFLY